MTKDLTQGPTTKLIVSFAIPLLFGNLLQQLYSVVDTIVVGRFVGYQALASIGAASAVIQLLIGFASGISGGVSVVTAQNIGAKDEVKVHKSVAMGSLICLIASLLLGGIGILLARPLYLLMQTPTDVIDGTALYARIMFIGAPATLMYNYVSGILRAFGDSRTPLVGLIIASVLNVLLDLAFVVLFGWGIAGVAVATLISQLVSGLVCGFYAYRHIPMLQIRKADFALDISIVKSQLKVGIPMAFHSSVLALGSLMMQTVLNTLGTMTMAAYTLAGRVDVFLYACLSAFGTATTTFTAQNFGAGRLDRVKHAVRRTGVITVSICLAFTLLLLAFSTQLFQMLVGANETEVIRLSVMYVRANSIFYPLLGIMFVVLHAEQGLGKPTVAMLSSVVELAVRPAAAFLLARQFGFSGFRFSNAAAWSPSFIMLVVSYVIIIRRLEKSSAFEDKKLIN